MSLHILPLHPLFATETLSGSAEAEVLPYESIPRSKQARRIEQRLDSVRTFLHSLARPDDLSDPQFTSFIRYSQQFFVDIDERLWRKDEQGHHCLVIPQTRRIPIMIEAHEKTGHKGIWATNSSIHERFWWPRIIDDVKWFITTCHICQL
ncbi:hypothetical protein GGU10DRAFT_278080, partial [Lentinula aff. detonsa]